MGIIVADATLGIQAQLGASYPESFLLTARLI